MEHFDVFAPAKINLFLAVTERRTDGFHNLVSVAAPLAWGDTLRFEPSGAEGPVSLACEDPSVPLGEDNLILRAAKAFRERSGWCGGGVFRLEKRVPMGAGLGGGSSDAAAALKILNAAAGAPFSLESLSALSATVGSDCPLFLSEGPVVMRGRGERLERLPEGARKRLSGRRVFLFKPSFGISTPWAYGRLAARAPASYLPPAEAERRLAAWLAEPEAPAERLLFNNMEPPAFEKYLLLPALAGWLRERFGLASRMSGSGSACFALLPEKFDASRLSAEIREKWGESLWSLDTHLGLFP